MNGQRVFLVESEPTMAGIVTDGLTRLGYVVCGSAASGEAAIAAIGQAKPDLVVVETALESGQDGVEVGATIHGRFGLAVVFVTRHLSRELVSRARATGPVAPVLPPLDADTLVPVLDMALRSAVSEQELAARGEWFSTALRSIGDGVIATDPHGRIKTMNPVAERLTGWSLAEAVNRPLQDVFRVIHEQSKAPVECPVEGAIRECRTVRLPPRTLLLERSGQPIPIDDAAAPILDRHGTVSGVVLVFHDEIDRRRAERALALSEEQHRTTLDSMADAIYVVDADLRITLVNRTMREWHARFGLSRDPLGRDLLHVHPFLAQKDIDEYRQALATGRTVISEARLQVGDKTVFTECRKIPVVEDGKTTRVVTVLRDVTETKQAEQERLRLREQVQQVQKLEGLGVLAGGIAHDFNNILMGVLGNAELALMQLPDNTPASQLIRTVRESALRAADLCKQMLTFSGKTPVARQMLSLNDLVKDMGSLVDAAVSRKARIDRQYASSLPAVLADPGQVRQIILNLVTNAAEAVDECAGCITIATRQQHCDRAFLDALYLHDDLNEGTYVVLEVADNGCGMDESTKARIFDPFFSTKFLGRGLGLAAVLGIVRAHRGGIKVDSQPGTGTVFTVLLPVPVQPQAPAKPKTGTNGGPRTVLLVDDEETVRTVVGRALTTLGYPVLPAADGRQAIDIFRDRHHEVGLVLLDLTMPEMDGNETYRELRRIQEDVRVILSSGYTQEDACSRLCREGVAGFIQKPYRVRELQEKIRQVMS